ncbi:MAG: alpha/beta hydrolase, partial [Verrucomicrobiota bacterium]
MKINNRCEIIGDFGFWQNARVVYFDARVSGYHDIWPYDINNNGAILATAVDDEVGYNHNVLLLPVELGVDGNHDGVIQLGSSSDQTTAEKPYKFWINDDHDDADQGDIIDSHHNYDDENITCIRDLEDYARLWINMTGVSAMLQANNGICAGLKWEPIPGASGATPTIKIFQAVETSGSTGYLSDVNTANQQISGSYDVPVEDKNGITVVGSNAFILPKSFWDGFDDTHPKHLIFEGVSEGKGKLVLVFFDSSGNPIGEGGAVYMDIKNIKKMYERVQGLPQNIAAPYEQSAGPFTGPVSCQHIQDGQTFDKPSDETTQCVVFVHGWNNSQDESINAAETMFKRLWWQGYKGHFCMFRWDTLVSGWMYDPGQFNRSESRAWVYGAALKTWGNYLSTTGGYTVSLIGHSMGNVVCGEALRQGMGVRNYLLMQGAVAASCYDPNVLTEPTLVDEDTQIPTPDWHVDPVSNQQTNGYRGYLQNVQGTLVNFNNRGDWA